ncbi:MAG TPA: CrcB family protein [Rhodoglobus sp.]|nr:CrcB family protein [Rhodoglobus sp.]
MIVAAAIAAGALGAAIRYGLSLLIRAPWAVLVVNVVGSALGGVLLAVAPDDLRLVLLSGLGGGLTTFSTLSVETVQLAEEGRLRVAVLSAALNLILGVAAAGAGFAIASSL